MLLSPNSLDSQEPKGVSSTVECAWCEGGLPVDWSVNVWYPTNSLQDNETIDCREAYTNIYLKQNVTFLMLMYLCKLVIIKKIFNYFPIIRCHVHELVWMLTVSDCAQKNYQLVLFLSKVLHHQNCTHEQLYVLLFKCKIRFHLSLNHS